MDGPDANAGVWDPHGTNRTGGEEFEILAHGLFPRMALSVEYRPGGPSWGPAAEVFIERAWTAYLRASEEAGIVVYNGDLFRLDNFRRADGRLHLVLSDSDFRASIGTSSPRFASAFPDLPRANPLTVSIVLVCDDGKIVIEKRSRVDSRRRAYHVIAGYMERNLDAGGNHHPFNAMEREVQEELGVELDRQRLRATGLVRTMHGCELCFRGSVSLSFDRLLEVQADSATDSEIEALQPIDDSPSAITAFLASHVTDLVPSGRACLLLYGREAYGEGWYRVAGLR